MNIKIKRGDAFTLPVRILINGEAWAPVNFEAVEFRLAKIRKTYPEEVAFDGESGCFLVPLSQEDTFTFPTDDAVLLDVRVKFAGGAVIGSQKPHIFVAVDALSEVVI